MDGPLELAADHGFSVLSMVALVSVVPVALVVVVLAIAKKS